MRLVTVTLLFFIAASLKADPFYVAFIKGRVSKGGTLLKAGDVLEIDDNATLEFSSKDDLVVVVKPNKGRYVIRPQKIQQSQNRLWVLVKDNLIPCTQKNSLTTRSAQSLDLSEFLKGGRLAFIKKMSIPIDSSFWEDRHKNFFFLRYTLRGDQIKKSLPFQEPATHRDTLKLIIDESIFVVNESKVESGEASGEQLFFYQKSVDDSIKIKDLNIVLLTDERVLAEVKSTFYLIRTHLYQDTPSIEKELYSHVEEFYGKTDRASMSELVKILMHSEEKN